MQFDIYVGRTESLLLELRDRISEGRQTHVVTLNSEMIVMSRRLPEFNLAIKSADIIVPDGIGVCLAIRVLKGIKAMRIAGIDLAESILSICEKEGLTVYLLGARSHVIEKACENLRKTYPGLQIAGYHHGYFYGEEERVIQEIASSQAKVLLVGMGAPYQELFIARTRNRLPCVFMMGVGGSFDVWGGFKRRAAPWIRKAGFEWLFRALQDYTRWRRLKFMPAFIWLVLSTKFRGNVT